MSFKKTYKEFLIYASARLKKQSFDCLVYNFNSNILSFFENYLIEDIDNNLIEKWQTYILQKNFCNNHNKNLYAMLKKFLNYCYLYHNFDKKIIDTMVPFKLRVEKEEKDYYNLKEFKKFIKYVDNNIYKQFFYFMFFTGTRPGEAMALKFSDIKGKYISINKTIDEHGKREIGTPKTLSSIRLVSLDNKLLKDLQKLKKHYNKIYKNTDYFIFGGLKPLAPTTINRYKLKACNKANIRPITLHQFRHSHATLLFNKKIDIHVIAQRLGHSNVSTTLNVYTHANKEQEKRVLKALNCERFNFFDCCAYNFYKKIKPFIKTFFQCYNQDGASDRDRTGILALARPYTNHCTTPAIK